jgi:hypothetical protein
MRAAMSAAANTQMNTQTTILVLLAGRCLTRIERDFHGVEWRTADATPRGKSGIR